MIFRKSPTSVTWVAGFGGGFRRSAHRDKKTDPYGYLGGTPQRNAKKKLQLSLLPHFSYVSALLKACYSCIPIQLHIFSVFLNFCWVLMDFTAF